MVKIIKGTYGHRKGKNIVPVYVGETVELSKEQEARLVKIGVAVYVETAKKELGVSKETATSGKEIPEKSEEVSYEDEELPNLNAAEPVDDE